MTKPIPDNIEEAAALLGHAIWQGWCAVCGDDRVVITQDPDLGTPRVEPCPECGHRAVYFTLEPPPGEARP